MENTSLSPLVLLGIIAIYFLVLFVISQFTSKDADTQTFFTAKRQSPWYLVAFGMVGGSLSGVTFISVPGWVAASEFSYMQMVFGYLLGYLVIATVLMPMYYRMHLTSIYTYLEDRFGFSAYQTGAAFFLLSRTVQASFRLYLVAIVIQTFIMSSLGVPFWLTVLMTIALIWVYTFKGGIKTIVWTDTLQTLCMLVAVVVTIVAIGQAMDLSFGGLVQEIKGSEYSKMFFFEGGWGDSKNFFKQFLAGAFIAIVMTGLDQDMMQKNLTCKNIGDAQKNMFWFSVILIFANVLFLSLGVLLYAYVAHLGIEPPAKSDLLYPMLAFNYLPASITIVFVLGLIAAAYSSADSALTALTTSFCIDILGFGEMGRTEARMKKTRVLVHIGFSFLLFLIILIFYGINDDAVISAIFKVAGYTYGPLLGLYTFGFFTKIKIRDRWAPIICMLSPVLTYIINANSESWLGGYKFGFELLLLNGLLTFLGLLLISRWRGQSHQD